VLYHSRQLLRVLRPEPGGLVEADARAAIDRGAHLGGWNSSTDEDLSSGSTVWRWDADDEHYIFNAKSSRNWNEGAWETEVSFAGIVLASTNFQLRR
jgi:hypothetical protein